MWLGNVMLLVNGFPRKQWSPKGIAVESDPSIGPVERDMGPTLALCSARSADQVEHQPLGPDLRIHIGPNARRGPPVAGKP